MIKFFRKIRQRLLAENKISKYLLYAIGEITLVVIGIMIALSVNNWNSWKKDRELETDIIKEIKDNLQLDLEEIRVDISLMDSITTSSYQLIKFLESQSVPSQIFYDNIAKLRVNPHFNPNTSGYELLTSRGIEIIQNDSLRGAITSVYKLSYPYYYQYESERVQFKLHQINPFLLNHFTWKPNPSVYFQSSYTISNKEYELVRKEGYLLKMIYAIIQENNTVKDRAKYIENKLIQLLKLIHNELEIRK